MKWRNDAGLAGNSVVVTGAGGGIGSAVARGFAEAGSKVLLVDIPSAPLNDVLKTLTGTGHQILPCDLSDLKSHANIFEKAAEAAEVVALAHCAAVLRRRATVDDVTEEDWDLQIDVNMKATFFLNLLPLLFHCCLKHAGRPRRSIRPVHSVGAHPEHP